MARKSLLIGNWKMHGTGADLTRVERLRDALASDLNLVCEAMICPPATLISRVAHLLKDSPVRLGAQDCHAAVSGAHTGEISAEMLRDAGAEAVILGHSERRAERGEGDSAVRAKVAAAVRAGLAPIVCLGEQERERENGLAFEVVDGQFRGSLPLAVPLGLIVAYEPVWAIGTGRTASRKDISEMHQFLHAQLVARFGGAGAAVPVIYGGSVKPKNAGEILGTDGVDGALVGGASLDPNEFLQIIGACSG